LGTAKKRNNKQSLGIGAAFRFAAARIGCVELPMPIEDPRYDVAISFLSKDGNIAAALNERLTEGFKVFFFPRRQEELAGTDGLESMRKPFFDDSRMTVVLYRDGWGETPWTRVEKTAITDSCLAHGWQRLFFVILDQTSTLPVWLPHTHVRFNFSEYGIEQAVGAIKLRIQEQGGQNLPMTPTRRAEIFEAQEKFRRDELNLNSPEGWKSIFNSAGLLFQQIERHCTEVNSRQGSLQIRCGFSLNEQSSLQECIITNEHVAISVCWLQRYVNTLEGSSLTVREFPQRLMLPSETRGRMYIDPPRSIAEFTYSPALSLARELGWKRSGTTEFISSPRLAEQCVIQFMDLARRGTHGKLT
jgi:hypothetical protein